VGFVEEKVDYGVMVVGDMWKWGAKRDGGGGW